MQWIFLTVQRILGRAKGIAVINLSDYPDFYIVSTIPNRTDSLERERAHISFIAHHGDYLFQNSHAFVRFSQIRATALPASDCVLYSKIVCP